jgi:hypothetical protein
MLVDACIDPLLANFAIGPLLVDGEAGSDADAGIGAVAIAVAVAVAIAVADALRMLKAGDACNVPIGVNNNANANMSAVAAKLLTLRGREV